MTPITVTLTGPQVAELKSISKETGLTVSDLMRRALEMWLEARKQKQGS